MKKLLTAGLVLLSVATLAACGNKSSDSASKASSSTEQTSASQVTKKNLKTNLTRFLKNSTKMEPLKNSAKPISVVLTYQINLNYNKIY